MSPAGAGNRTRASRARSSSTCATRDASAALQPRTPRDIIHLNDVAAALLLQYRAQDPGGRHDCDWGIVTNGGFGLRLGLHKRYSNSRAELCCRLRSRTFGVATGGQLGRDRRRDRSGSSRDSDPRSRSRAPGFTKPDHRSKDRLCPDLARYGVSDPLSRPFPNRPGRPTQAYSCRSRAVHDWLCRGVHQPGQLCVVHGCRPYGWSRCTRPGLRSRLSDDLYNGNRLVQHARVCLLTTLAHHVLWSRGDGLRVFDGMRLDRESSHLSFKNLLSSGALHDLLTPRPALFAHNGQRGALGGSIPGGCRARNRPAPRPTASSRAWSVRSVAV